MMAKRSTAQPPTRNTKTAADPDVAFLGAEAAEKARFPHLHVYGSHVICDTDKLGHKMPEERSPLEIVVDATEGFIPLWDRDVTLRWRFNEASMTAFTNPASAKIYIRRLFGEAVSLWGLGNVPVRFTEVADAWDFEFKVTAQPNCSQNGCVLARAFFPDAGQHDIMLYPSMFSQARNEQVETLAHEIGHVFGLRHFFAKIEEARWPSEIFGRHSRFSIMNYGADSRMTENDRADMRALYGAAWSRTLTRINGTPIRLIRPFSTLRVPGPSALSFAAAAGYASASA